MARPLDPNDPGGGGTGDPGNPGYVPGTDPNAKIALVVTTTAATITSEHIAAAGGPWPSYTVRVTPVNDRGSGMAQEVTMPDGGTGTP